MKCKQNKICVHKLKSEASIQSLFSEDKLSTNLALGGNLAQECKMAKQII